MNGRHGLILDACEKLSISGVTDVDAFDEHKVKVFTECGELSVFGEQLHVNEMSLQSGSISIEGKVTAMIYGDEDAKKRRSLLGKLFK